MKLFGFALIMLSILSVFALPKAAVAASSYFSNTLTINCSDAGTSAKFTLKNNSKSSLYALKIESGNMKIGPVVVSSYSGMIQLPIKPQDQYRWSLQNRMFIGRMNVWTVIDQGIFSCSNLLSIAIDRVNVAPCRSSSCMSITTAIISGKGFDPEAKVQVLGLKYGGKNYEGTIAGRNSDSQIIVDFHNLSCDQWYKIRVINPSGRVAVQKDILMPTGCNLAG